MKKSLFTAALLAVALTLGAVSCGSGDDNPSGNNGEVSVEAKSIPEVAEEIKAAYGEEYLVDTDIDSDMLAELFGVKSEWVAEYFGQMPLLSFNSDILLIIRANDGKAGDVQKALESYLAARIDSLTEYPEHMPKIKAANIHKVGNYVCYVSLGLVDTKLENTSSSVEYYKGRNDKAIEIIDKYLK